MYDYETTADLNEAVYYEGLDADMEMANYEAEGARLAAMRKRGICTHGSMQGQPTGAGFAKIPDLPEGMMVCTDGCGGLFPADSFPEPGEKPRGYLTAYKREDMIL